MHTFSHLDRRVYLMIQVGVLVAAILLWLLVFAPVVAVI